MMNLYIARDQSYIEYENETDDYGTNIPGKLHIFYDTPELKHVPAQFINSENVWSISSYRKWTNARCIGEIPSYMFPEIQEGKCVVFENKI